MLDSSGSDLLSDCSHAPSGYGLKDVALSLLKCSSNARCSTSFALLKWNATNEKQLRALVKSAVD